LLNQTDPGNKPEADQKKEAFMDASIMVASRYGASVSNGGKRLLLPKCLEAGEIISLKEQFDYQNSQGPEPSRKFMTYGRAEGEMRLNKSWCHIEIRGDNPSDVKKLRELMLRDAGVIKEIINLTPSTFNIVLPDAWARLVWLIKWIIKG
jgi:hypothetical protein